MDGGEIAAFQPSNSWARRAPVRLADACVGLLAAAIADRVAAPTALFTQYAKAHAGRVLPPLVATFGKALARKLSIADIARTLKQARDVRIYLSRNRFSRDAGPMRSAPAGLVRDPDRTA